MVEKGARVSCFSELEPMLAELSAKTRIYDLAAGTRYMSIRESVDGMSIAHQAGNRCSILAALQICYHQRPATDII